MENEPHKRLEHSLIEDTMAFVIGCAMCALSIQFLTFSGLITGQTAGLAVLLSYVTGLSFGQMFFLVNIPFYALAWFRMGPRFTIKTLVAVATLSVFTEFMPVLFTIGTVHPGLSAFLAGCTSGMGLLVLFRHGASLGGVGILALVLQERAGVQAGWVQLGFDVLLFCAALFVLPLDLVIYSLAGAVVVNVMVGVNHRKDRYVGR